LDSKSTTLVQTPEGTLYDWKGGGFLEGEKNQNLVIPQFNGGGRHPKGERCGGGKKSKPESQEIPINIYPEVRQIVERAAHTASKTKGKIKESGTQLEIKGWYWTNGDEGLPGKKRACAMKRRANRVMGQKKGKRQPQKTTQAKATRGKNSGVKGRGGQNSHVC